MKPRDFWSRPTMREQYIIKAYLLLFLLNYIISLQINLLICAVCTYNKQLLGDSEIL